MDFAFLTTKKHTSDAAPTAIVASLKPSVSVSGLSGTRSPKAVNATFNTVGSAADQVSVNSVSVWLLTSIPAAVAASAID